MSPHRDNKWWTPRGLAGGLGMFLAEALAVAGFAVVAWLLAVVIIAAL